MVPNNVLDLPWPTMRFFLDMKATSKTKKQEFLLFVYRKKGLFLLKSKYF